MGNNVAKASAEARGIGFTGLLQVAFIVLKLCKVIDWSWKWVLAPLWISIGTVLFILVGVIIAVMIQEHKGGRK